MGYIDDQLVVNPTYKELRRVCSIWSLLARDAIVMVEGGARESPESILLPALETAHQALQPCIDLQLHLQRTVKGHDACHSSHAGCRTRAPSPHHGL